MLSKGTVAGVGAALVLLLVLSVGDLVAQEKQPPARPNQPGQKQAEKTPPGQPGIPGMTPEMAEMMKKYEELMAPGPEHEEFKKAVGTWDAVTRMWMAPGTEPMESKGMAKFTLVHDGRYLQQEFTCTMMDKPYHGRGLEGYNKFRQQYESTWTDSMSTAIMFMTGKREGPDKIVFTGKVDEPMTGERDKPIRAVLRNVSDNQIVFEMYDKPQGMDEFKCMEITYTRRPG